MKVLTVLTLSTVKQTATNKVPIGKKKWGSNLTRKTFPKNGDSATFYMANSEIDFHKTPSPNTNMQGTETCTLKVSPTNTSMNRTKTCILTIPRTTKQRSQTNTAISRMKRRIGTHKTLRTTAQNSSTLLTPTRWTTWLTKTTRWTTKIMKWLIQILTNGMQNDQTRSNTLQLTSLMEPHPSKTLPKIQVSSSLNTFTIPT